jgi:asparaginyl-tRNA synthetase
VKRTKIKDVLQQGAVDTKVWIQAWVRTKRESKTFAFLEMNDGSTIRNIQVVVDSAMPGYAEAMKSLSTGASAGISGKLVASQGKGQSVEIQASEIVVYGTADPETYPLQKKGHTLEFLREIAHLRPRTNTFGAVLRVRNTMAYAIHSFFQERGFCYLHTPLITGSDTEGAGEMFTVSSFDLNHIPKTEDGQVDFSKDFFGKHVHLTVSGQLNGETAALALSDIYTFGPTFRAENSNTARHLAEFWMVEPEMAFYDLTDNMDLAEAFLKHLIKTALELPRPILQNRIDQRVDMMFEMRLLNEVESLLPHKQLNALQTVGYTECFEYFDGLSSLEATKERIKIHTRQYAKRQMTWFKKDELFHWFDPTKPDVANQIVNLIGN